MSAFDGRALLYHGSDGLQNIRSESGEGARDRCVFVLLWWWWWLLWWWVVGVGVGGGECDCVWWCGCVGVRRRGEEGGVWVGVCEEGDDCVVRNTTAR